MLSKALAKANTAVQLDNAQNYEGARESYIEACELLQQVLARTTGEEDRNKLEAIVSSLPGALGISLHIGRLSLEWEYPASRVDGIPHERGFDLS